MARVIGRYCSGEGDRPTTVIAGHGKEREKRGRRALERKGKKRRIKNQLHLPCHRIHPPKAPAFSSCPPLFFSLPFRLRLPLASLSISVAPAKNSTQSWPAATVDSPRKQGCHEPAV